MAIATSVSSSVHLTQLDFEASAPSPKQPYPLSRMEWNPFDVTQQRRYYTRGPPPNEHNVGDLGDLSPYPQPQYARREHSDPAQSHWTPPAWPNTGLSRTPMLNSSLGPQFPSLNVPQNIFDGAFQQTAPWTPVSSSNPNGTLANLTLPFPASDSIFANRTSSIMMNPITAGTSLSSSRGLEKTLIESNDDDDDDDDDDEEELNNTTNLEPTVTSPKADALHKVAWGTKRDSEAKSVTPPKSNKRSVKSRRTPRESIGKAASASNKSNSDSESNHRSKSRLNHDQTEKRYRNRLNYQFDNLLSAIPARLIAESEGSIGGPDDRREKRVNKAEVLILAKRHIEELERKQWEFKAENRRLAARVKEFEEAWARAGGRGNPLMP